MNLDKVISGFFIILAMTLNFGFFYGDMLNIDSHSKYELFAAIIINLIATILKLGDKTQLGSVLLATSLVADIQLIAAALVWTIAAYSYSINSEVIGRERPFYYFVPVFLAGFMPWSFIFIASIYDGCKKLIEKFHDVQGTFMTKLFSLFDVTTK